MLVKVQGRVKVRFPFLVIQLEMIFGWLMLTIKIPFLGNFLFWKLYSKMIFGLLMSAIKISFFGNFPFGKFNLEIIFWLFIQAIKVSFLSNFPFRKLHSKVDFGLLMSAIKTSSFGISFLGLYAGLAYSNGLEKSLNSPMALKYHRQKCFMI